MAELPQGAEGVVGRGDRRPPLAGTDRIVGAALGISGSCDRQGLAAVATSNQLALPGLGDGNLAADACVNCVGFSVPPRRSARDGASGENSMLTPAARGRQRVRSSAMSGDRWRINRDAIASRDAYDSNTTLWTRTRRVGNRATGFRGCEDRRRGPHSPVARAAARIARRDCGAAAGPRIRAVDAVSGSACDVLARPTAAYVDVARRRH